MIGGGKKIHNNVNVRTLHILEFDEITFKLRFHHVYLTKKMFILNQQMLGSTPVGIYGTNFPVVNRIFCLRLTIQLLFYCLRTSQYISFFLFPASKSIGIIKKYSHYYNTFSVSIFRSALYHHSKYQDSSTW